MHRTTPALPILVAVATLGLALRAALFLRPGGYLDVRLNYDEGVFVAASALLAEGVLPYRDFVFVHPPGIFFLMGPLALLFAGDPALFFAVSRVVGLLLGFGTVLLIGVVAGRSWGAFAGIAAALLYATHPEAVPRDRGVVLEPALNLVCITMAAVWLEALERPRPRWRLAAGGFLAGLAVVVKLWGVLWLPAMALVLPRGRRRDGLALLLLGLVAAFLVFVLPFALPGPREVLTQVVGFQALRPPQGTESFIVRARQIFLEAPLALLGLAIALRTRDRRAAFFALAFTLVVLAFLASKVFFMRYTSHLAVPGSVLGGFALVHVARWASARRARAWVAPGVLALVVLTQTALALRNSIAYRAPWQAGLVGAIRTHVPADGCVVAIAPAHALVAGHLPPVRPGLPVLVDLHAHATLTWILERSEIMRALRGPGATRRTGVLRELLRSCGFVVSPGWGLSSELREWVRRDWIRRYPPPGRRGAVLWESRAGPDARARAEGAPAS